MSALQFVVQGGQKLSGTIHPSGNKNAALPIICAALLTEHPVTLTNVPRIRDVETLVELIASMGADVSWTARNTLADPRQDDPSDEARSRLCRKIRASILLAGPLLARCGEIELPPPGGDVIGRRRVDTHFLALERLGASFELNDSFNLSTRRASRRRRLPRRAQRHRHRERALRRGRGHGNDDPSQRGQRAARAGPLSFSRRVGRGDRRHRHQQAHDQRRAPARRRDASHRARSHRSRIVHRTWRPSPRRDLASPTPASSICARRSWASLGSACRA